MRIPSTVLEEIKSRLDIVQYVSRYVDLKRSGSNLKGLCPFHQEKTPSFMVNPAKGIFKCFGCGEGGDIISFLRGIENISFYESIKLLAKEGGVDLSEYETPEALAEITQSDLLYKINDEARSFFIERLLHPSAIEARNYLVDRGVSKETQKEFSIGFAPPDGDGLIRHLTSKGFSTELISESGLAVTRENGSMIDKFRNRIIVPFQNLSSLTCGFTGRVINDTDTPKYLNSPETAVFKKGNFLFGLLQAREAVKRDNHIILVEGNFDLITLSQGGIVNAAATSGTALTDRQALLIKRFADKVTLVYDGDKAGQAATERGLPVLMNAGLTVRVSILPEGEDPDSFLRKHGREAFNKLSDSAVDVVEFTLKRFAAQRDLSVPENKALLVNEITSLLQNVSNPVLKSEYLKKASEKSGVAERFFVGKPVYRKNHDSAPSRNHAESQLISSIPPYELRLLELLIENCESCLASVNRFVHQGDITSSTARTLLKAITDNGCFHSSLLAALPPDASDLASRIAVTHTHKPASESALLSETHEIILKIKEKSLKRARTELMKKMRSEGAEKDALLKEFDALTQEINSIRTLNSLESEKKEVQPL